MALLYSSHFNLKQFKYFLRTNNKDRKKIGLSISYKLILIAAVLLPIFISPVYSSDKAFASSVEINTPANGETLTEPYNVIVTANFTNEPAENGYYGYINIETSAYNNIGERGYACYSSVCTYNYFTKYGGSLLDVDHEGPYTITATIFPLHHPEQITSDTNEFTMDKTPTIAINSPIGTVAPPVEYNVTFNYRPDQHQTQGNYWVWVDGVIFQGKDKTPCSSETCAFSYTTTTSESNGLLQSGSPPGHHILKVKAQASGDVDWTAEATSTFDVVACLDKDGDGHNKKNQFCTGSDDCNDNDPAIRPGASEICDGNDNNCNGLFDEGLSTDADGDGHYAAGSCKTPNDDCNDNDSTIFQGCEKLLGNLGSPCSCPPCPE